MERHAVELLDVATVQDWIHDIKDSGTLVLSQSVVLTSYVWILYTTFTAETFQTTLAAPVWLLLLALVSLRLRSSNSWMALPALSAALFGATLLQTWASGITSTVYLIIPSAFLAGLFYAPRKAMVAQSLLGLAVLLEEHLFHGTRLFSGPMLLPLIALGETALVTWVSSSSLRGALDWAVEGYAHALSQAQAAQERQAQLQQAYRSLDEASYRLQRMNLELARVTDASEELRRLKQEFVTGISHELRTPLAMIVGFSEMMYMAPETYASPLPAEYLGDVREIYRNSQHLIGLIDDILDLSRISAGRMQLSRSPSDLRELVLDTVNMIRPLVEGKGLALNAFIADDIGSAYIDPTRIRQVLLNLLNNARRFVEHGEISVSLRTEGDHVVCSVADTGIGIPLDEQRNVFERFRQVNGTMTRGDYEGAGLGLAISKEFVEMHGGRIWLESEGVAGRGCTFHFTLPLAGQEAKEATLQATRRGSPHGGPLPKLLFVTTDADVLAPVQRSLGAYEIIWVQDRQELPLMVERHAPLAVLASPPSQNELDEIEQLREILSPSRVPIIWFPFGAEQALARSLGVNSYLVKPIRRQSVLQAMDRLGSSIRRVLVVDDDPRVVQLLTRMIRSDFDRYEVLHAYDGDEGLSVLRAQSADAIITDLIMPEIDGRAFIEKVRQEERFRDIPIIVVTAKAFDMDDSPSLSGNLLGLSYGRGMHNTESLTYVAQLLDSLQSVQPLEAPAAH